MSMSVAMMNAITLVEFGGPENLQLGEIEKPSPKAGEISIKTVVSGINRADTLQRKGSYPAPPGASTTLGLETVGTVDAVGEGVTQFKIGDRVCALLAGGGYAEYVTVPAVQAFVPPASLSWNEAGAIPEVWLTAFQLLHMVGEVKAGDVVLIHAGASGVGTAAMQLALAAGAKPIFTAGGKDKIKEAMQYGALAGFDRHEGEWAPKVIEYLQGSQVNVILDCVGSSYWKQNVEVLAPDARWVVFGLMGGANVDGPLLGNILRKRIRITGSTLRARTTEYKGALVAAFCNIALPLFETGKLKPVIDKTFPLADASAAHAYMEENKSVGKILLVVDSKTSNPKSEL
eukprot:m.117386 g.117386  ORF g.117386 m.117386 type:complete len:345 (-) comp28577_c0_seq1:100-1134(-)